MPEHASGWSDDFFLGTIAAVRAGDAEGLAAAVRLVTTTAARLQQPDGLFHHDADAPTAWGRGNGFGALGLSELLTVLPADHPEREAVLDIHRRHLAGMRSQQAPDGMWRQIVDVPGSYRETSVTAMTLTAMARGIRMGWLDDSYRPVVDRAWRALLAHVADDGTLVDVCFSTGAGSDAAALPRPARRQRRGRPRRRHGARRGAGVLRPAAGGLSLRNRRTAELLHYRGRLPGKRHDAVGKSDRCAGIASTAGQETRTSFSNYSMY